jgi:hypothetical protein
LNGAQLDILGLEVVVDAELVALGEASLGAEVVVAKVVAVAGRLVGRAAVSTPSLSREREPRLTRNGNPNGLSGDEVQPSVVQSR